jgi:hypothetical protein
LVKKTVILREMRRREITWQKPRLTGEKTMNENNNELNNIKDMDEFAHVVRKIQASGIVDDEEISEIIRRDYRHLFRELTEAEKEKVLNQAKDSIVERAFAEINRESIKENGHPAFVCLRIDGAKHFKAYDAFTQAEIAELKATGIIL